MKKYYFLLVTFVINAFSADAQVTLNEINAFENGLISSKQAKDSIVKQYNIWERMKKYQIPAVSIAIIKDRKIIFAKAYGMADVKKNVFADTLTLFHAASIGKAINALCFMKLTEEKKISLQDDFRKYIKDGSFIENDISKNEKITIANLLSHTAGINRNDAEKSSYMDYSKLPSITQIIKGEKPALGKGAFSVEKPNKRYLYSNQGINISQKIITDLLVQDYESITQKMVFEPLSMTQSTFKIRLSKAEQKKLANGYQGDNQKVDEWIFPSQAEGGLRTNAIDLAKLVIALQKSYRGEKGAILQKSTVDMMFTPQLDTVSYAGNLDVPYKNGLGLMLFEKGNVPYFSHTGFIDGYVSLFIGDYEGNNGAVILTNYSSNAKIIPEILNSIATTFQWKDFMK